MNNKIISVLMALLLATTTIASADTLGLTQKTAGNWLPVSGGATAILTYNTEGATFDYTVDGTVPLLNTQYALIYYADIVPTGSTVPGVVGKVIAFSTSNELGNIHMSGSKVMDSIPYSPEDANSLVDSNGGFPGAKIWLVPSNDIVDNGEGVPKTLNWVNYPTNYLFEENMVGVTVTNGVPSHLINYEFVEPVVQNIDVTGTMIVTCAPKEAAETATYGLMADDVVFDAIVAGSTSEGSLDVTIQESPGTDCNTVDKTIEVSVTPDVWKNEADETVDITTASVTPQDVNIVGGTSVPVEGTTNFALLASVGSAVYHGTYTSTITISAEF